MKLTLALSVDGSADEQADAILKLKRELEDNNDVAWVELNPEDKEDELIFLKIDKLESK